MFRLHVLWLMVVPLEWALDLSLARTALPPLQHFAVLAGEGLFCAVALGLAGLVARAALGVLRLAGASSRLQSRLAAGAWTLLCAILALSWLSYYQTGNFPSGNSVQFAEASAMQIAQHAFQQAPFAVLLTFASMVLVGPLTWWIASLADSRWGRPIGGVRRASAVGLVALLALIATLGAAHPSVHKLTTESATGAELTVGQLLDFQRRYHGGVFSSLAYQLSDSSRGDDLSKVRTNVLVERRKQLPLEAYRRRALASSGKRLNVIVLLVESMRNDVLDPSVPNRPDVMVNLDALSKRGRLFTNAYTQASHSDAADPCSLSGVGPLRGPYGCVSYPEDPPYPRVLIYDLLDAIGYRTALVSSQNETWGGMINFLDTGHLDFILHSETYDGPTYVPEWDQTFRAFLKGKKKAGKIDDRHTVTELIRWIGDGTEPFFAYVNLQNSHFPYETPADYPRRFTSVGERLEGRLTTLSDDQARLGKRLYWDALGYVDAQIGRVIEHLRNTGQLEQTILVISGDTGQAFMEHGFATHAQDLYNEVMRVPLLVVAPGVSPGVSHELAQHIDVPPTVLGLLGLPPHPAFQGRDLFGQAPGKPRSVYLSVRTFRHQAAIVHDGMKLIHDFRRNRVLLYDLKRDPAERHDLSRLRPDLVADLLGRLNVYLAETIEYYGDKQRLATEYAPVIDGGGN